MIYSINQISISCRKELCSASLTLCSLGQPKLFWKKASNSTGDLGPKGEYLPIFIEFQQYLTTPLKLRRSPGIVWIRGGSNTFNLLGIPNTFKYLYLTSNTKYFQSICIWPQILNTQSCQILFQILVKYFFEKKSIILFQKRANLPPFF